MVWVVTSWPVRRSLHNSLDRQAPPGAADPTTTATLRMSPPTGAPPNHPRMASSDAPSCSGLSSEQRAAIDERKRNHERAQRDGLRRRVSIETYVDGDGPAVVVIPSYRRDGGEDFEPFTAAVVIGSLMDAALAAGTGPGRHRVQRRLRRAVLRVLTTFPTREHAQSRTREPCFVRCRFCSRRSGDLWPWPATSSVT